MTELADVLGDVIGAPVTPGTDLLGDPQVDGWETDARAFVVSGPKLDGYLSLVSVVTAMYPAITVLLAVFVLRERAGWLPRAGLALSAVSLALIAR